MEQDSTQADSSTDSPSMLPKKPLFDHPLLTLVFATLTLSLASAFVTYKVVASRGDDPCGSIIGKARIEMKQDGPPSVFDEGKWGSITDQYNEIFEVCDAATANKFAAEEFNPWAAPALEILRPSADPQSQPSQGSSPAVEDPTSSTIEE